MQIHIRLIRRPEPFTVQQPTAATHDNGHRSPILSPQLSHDANNGSRDRNVYDPAINEFEGATWRTDQSDSTGRLRPRSARYFAAQAAMNQTQHTHTHTHTHTV